MSSGVLPEDYAVDALELEARRRGKRMRRPDYSYGKLVADTTPEERERICEEYRKNFRRRKRITEQAGE